MKRSILLSILAISCLFTDPLLAEPSGRPLGQESSDYDTDTLEKVWAGLGKSKSKKKKFLKAFLEKVEALDTVQLQLIQQLAIEAGKPEKPGKPPHFDPKVHTKNQPVKRKALKEKDERYQKVLRVLGKTNAEGLRAAYIYDWYAREIFRVGDPEDADRIFHNALLGMPPGFDLARASALKQMDQGHDEELMRAFAHTYTDREGGLYAGVTLYDVWRSGLDMEMPDVDTLGIVHTVLDDWESWTDPVPGTQHRSLFGAIGKLFGKARHYREPRESAVDCLLLADPIPRKDYESLHGNFHALWAHHDSDIAMVATDFPDAEGWLRYVKKWVDTCKSQTVWDKGLARKKQFDESDRALRGALIEALRDVRALE